MDRRRTLTRLLFYGAFFLLLVSIVTGVLAKVLPAHTAGAISHNSEGYVILLLLAGWIELVRPRIAGRTAVVVTGAAAIGCLAVGVGMLTLPLPTPLATLNEGFFAVSVLLVWVQLPRPVPRAAWVLTVVALVVPVVWHGSGAVIRSAEILMSFVFIPLGLDVVDRAILDPHATTRKPRVVVWMVAIVALSVVTHLLRTPSPTTLLQDVVDFLSRVNEVFIAAFFLHLYLTLLEMAPPTRVRDDQGLPRHRQPSGARS